MNHHLLERQGCGIRRRGAVISRPTAHGDTYESALVNAQNAPRLWLDAAMATRYLGRWDGR
jgi:hypothetical protein